VLAVVFLLAGALAGVGWIAGVQVKRLATRLPDYESNIRGRVETVRRWSNSWIPERARATLADLAGELKGDLA